MFSLPVLVPPTRPRPPSNVGSGSTATTSASPVSIVPTPPTEKRPPVGRSAPSREPPTEASKLQQKLKHLQQEDETESNAASVASLLRLEEATSKLLVAEEKEVWGEIKALARRRLMFEVPAFATLRVAREELDARNQLELEEGRLRQLAGKAHRWGVDADISCAVAIASVESLAYSNLLQQAEYRTVMVQVAVKRLQRVGRRYLWGWVHQLRWLWGALYASRGALIREEDDEWVGLMESFAEEFEELKDRQKIAAAELRQRSSSLQFCSLTLKLMYSETQRRLALVQREQQSRMALAAAASASREVLVPEAVEWRRRLKGLFVWCCERRLLDVLHIQSWIRGIWSGEVGFSATRRYLRDWAKRHKEVRRAHPSMNSVALDSQIEELEHLLVVEGSPKAVRIKAQRRLEVSELRGRHHIEQRQLDLLDLRIQRHNWDVFHILQRELRQTVEVEDVVRGNLSNLREIELRALRVELIEIRLRDRIELTESLHRRDLKAASTGKPKLVHITMWIQRKWRFMLAKRREDAEKIEALRRRLSRQEERIRQGSTWSARNAAVVVDGASDTGTNDGGELSTSSRGRSPQPRTSRPGTAGSNTLGATLSADSALSPLDGTINDLDVTMATVDLDATSILGQTKRHERRRKKFALSPASTALTMELRSPAPMSLYLADGNPPQRQGSTSPTQRGDLQLEWFSPPTALQRREPNRGSAESPLQQFLLDGAAIPTISIGNGAQRKEGEEAGSLTPQSEIGDTIPVEALPDPTEVLFDPEGRPIVTEANRENFFRLYGDEYFTELIEELIDMEEQLRGVLESDLFDRFYYFAEIERSILFPAMPSPLEAEASAAVLLSSVGSCARLSRRQTQSNIFTAQLKLRRRYIANVVSIEEDEKLNRRHISFDAEWSLTTLHEEVRQQPVFKYILIMTARANFLANEERIREGQIFGAEDTEFSQATTLFRFGLELLERAEANRKRALLGGLKKLQSPVESPLDTQPKSRRGSLFAQGLATPRRIVASSSISFTTAQNDGDNNLESPESPVELSGSRRQSRAFGTSQSFEVHSAMTLKESQRQARASLMFAEFDRFITPDQVASRFDSLRPDAQKRRENRFASVSNVVTGIQRWYRARHHGSHSIGKAALRIVHKSILLSQNAALAIRFARVTHSAIEDIQRRMDAAKAAMVLQKQSNFDAEFEKFLASKDTSMLQQGTDADRTRALKRLSTDFVKPKLGAIEAAEQAERQLRVFNWERGLRQLFVQVIQLPVLDPWYEGKLKSIADDGLRGSRRQNIQQEEASSRDKLFHSMCADSGMTLPRDLQRITVDETYFPHELVVTELSPEEKWRCLWSHRIFRCAKTAFASIFSSLVGALEDQAARFTQQQTLLSMTSNSLTDIKSHVDPRSGFAMRMSTFSKCPAKLRLSSGSDTGLDHRTTATSRLEAQESQRRFTVASSRRYELTKLFHLWESTCRENLLHTAQENTAEGLLLNYFSSREIFYSLPLSSPSRAHYDLLLEYQRVSLAGLEEHMRYRLTVLLRAADFAESYLLLYRDLWSRQVELYRLDLEQHLNSRRVTNLIKDLSTTICLCLTNIEGRLNWMIDQEEGHRRWLVNDESRTWQDLQSKVVQSLETASAS